MSTQRIYLIRHGETEWSLSGKHTGATDIPLTEAGRNAARRLMPVLSRNIFALVLTSPLRRARETCELAGFGDLAELDPDLVEWDYGEYEGLTTQQILATRPEWMIFTDGCPGGENPKQVMARIERVIGRIRAASGHVAIFAHGHFLRTFAARWLGLPAASGSHFLLDPATLSIVSFYRGIPAIRRWNAPLTP